MVKMRLISIPVELSEELKKLKILPQEPYYYVIQRLIEAYIDGKWSAHSKRNAKSMTQTQ